MTLPLALRTSRPGARRAPLRLLALPALLLAAAALAACVTINVYFPAAAAEKAADRIIEQVYGSGGTPPPAPTQPDKRSSLATAPDAGRALLAYAGRVLDLLVPAAHAQQPDLNVSTPAIRQLVASMEARHSVLAPHYASGAVGPTDDGVLEVRDQNSIPLAERTAVRKLVADENADRTALYAEIAQANGNPGWAADIRRTFARRWIDKAQPGWWVKEDGGWKRK
ncbi:MAG: YdbL family protein [Steroidobacteraceae bacterium]|jgi:uncharacterized protein YdbL (DUF1318 family)|nr:YdbL family protein [Steroidobacteraceae bacterium]